MEFCRDLAGSLPSIWDRLDWKEKFSLVSVLFVGGGLALWRRSEFVSQDAWFVCTLGDAE